MKISKLNASFGMLENSSISFHNGLNIIYSPNESGKTTWCAFILAMLYGIDSSARVRSGILPDKQKYAPWSGAPMEGTMELTANKCDITLQRTTRIRTAPMREFTATYTGTNEKVEGLSAADAGEKLTGVSREVFCRSAFIGQGNVTVTGNPELERRISAIVTTGEEDISYTEADKRLRNWQHKRRYNNRGLIPELDDRMNALQDDLHEIETCSDQISELEAEKAELETRCTELESAVTESRRTQRRNALESIGTARTAVNSLSRKHDEDFAALAAARDELRAGPFGAESLESAEEKVEQDLKTLKSLGYRRDTTKLTIVSALLLVLAACFAGIFTMVKESIAGILLAGAAGILCLAAVILFMKQAKVRRINQAAEDERQSILKKYHVTSASGITAQLEQHCGLWQAVNSAELAEKRSRADYETGAAALERTERAAISALDFTSGTSDAVKYSRELSSTRQKVVELGSRIAQLKGRLTTAGDPVTLMSSMKLLEEQRLDLNAEYDAITLAENTLREADAELQNRFSPELSKVTAEYMRILTGGRYSDVFLDHDFSAAARVDGDTVAHDSEYLSAGTIDLLYLAVRLAVCELAMPDGETCPLIIDDALVNLDPERFSKAIELLKEISKERQVILFTCREA